MSNEKTNIGVEPVYDAKKLGNGRMLLLGFQHMFAMFGATVLVPILTGLNMQTTLLMAGLGTLLFHVFTKLKVPAFLGSSFAFLGGYSAVTGANKAYGVDTPAEMLPLPSRMRQGTAIFLYFPTKIKIKTRICRPGQALLVFHLI